MKCLSPQLASSASRTTPHYENEAILAIAAVDETTAADAIDLVRVDYEPLPFALDPLDSLRPGSPDARLEGNTRIGRDFVSLKWTQEDFDNAPEGSMPMPDDVLDADGEVVVQKWSQGWEVGDVEAGLAEADLILDETIVHQSLTHHPMEPRSLDVVLAERAALHPHVHAEPGTDPASGRRPARPGHRRCGHDRRVLRRGIREQDHRQPDPAGAGAVLPLKSTVRSCSGSRGPRRTVSDVPGPASRPGSGSASAPTAVSPHSTLPPWEDGGPFRRGDQGSSASTASLTYTPLNMRFRGVGVFYEHTAQSGPARPGRCPDHRDARSR